MPFIEMDPKLAFKAIEGYQNELGPEKRKLDAFYRQFVCKRCGGAVQKETASWRHAFGDPEILTPRAVLRCTQCRMLFCPHTGIILENGNPDAVLNVPIVGQR